MESGKAINRFMIVSNNKVDNWLPLMGTGTEPFRDIASSNLNGDFEPDASS